ncbi:MAG: ComE operon protein 1 [Candidatus Marinimicrobia bacterium]|nr:ComE operon protein 1 [Candidatus Neomarinimicrobiota bacterium]
MRLTPQERRVVGFLLIVLVISASIRIVEHFFNADSQTSQIRNATSDSLFQTKAELVDSLVRTGAGTEETTDPDVGEMVESQKAMKIFINLADQNDLMKLPRIGPAMSKRIIAHREKNGYFKSFKNLRQVKGIGPATIEKLRPLITFNTVRP